VGSERDLVTGHGTQVFVGPDVAHRRRTGKAESGGEIDRLGDSGRAVLPIEERYDLVSVRWLADPTLGVATRGVKNGLFQLGPLPLPGLAAAACLSGFS
jgi:hypothetical protein